MRQYFGLFSLSVNFLKYFTHCTRMLNYRNKNSQNKSTVLRYLENYVFFERDFGENFLY